MYSRTVIVLVLSGLILRLQTHSMFIATQHVGSLKTVAMNVSQYNGRQKKVTLSFPLSFSSQITVHIMLDLQSSSVNNMISPMATHGKEKIALAVGTRLAFQRCSTHEVQVYHIKWENYRCHFLAASPQTTQLNKNKQHSRTDLI